MPLHDDRARAGSFGTVADQYDRFRPTYPEALLDDLAALGATRVLDVGCGTGKVAVPLAARGLDVSGVEVDERMAQVARGHGIDVQVAAFEDFDAAGRTMDLITCGDAWHWIDPARGLAKAAAVLAPGGTIARFWNTAVLDAAAVAAFDPIYRAHAPEIAQVWQPAQSLPRFHAADGDPFALSPQFSATETWTYEWERDLTTESWLGLIATISDHQSLGPVRLQPLLDDLRTAIDTLGGTIHSTNETYALVNHRN